MKTLIVVLLIILIGAVIVIGNKARKAAFARKATLDQLNVDYSQLVNTKWNLWDLRKFIESLPQSDLKQLGDLTGKSGGNAEDLTKQLLWLSSNAFAYPFKDPDKVDYHSDILVWVAEKNGISGCEDLSSFRIERRIFENKFAQIWDRLNHQQRLELLEKMKVSGLSESQKSAILAASGAVALTTLSATVAFSGFAFYTTMSTVIFTSAGFLGVTLPFAAYGGASSAVAVLSGPIGWSIALIAAGGATFWAAGPDPQRTAAFILAIHELKARRADEIVKKIQMLGGTAPGI